ncbi:hypothetical protein EOPP23_12000 [Endozoicomonas sp. OPT23]|uniref:PilW family protein n=1 Tax=Endozoicomonas sp. OPT23 TaxID=2072845 RepID=UPI00129A1419|nr:PilW family protein [Endozoicomonas sp. OPT23]MRI33709.1 hypothetical protein [Endozoicomonas sp. OPT23]
MTSALTRRNCQGVTILELMVALLLGLFLTTTFLQLMVGTSRSTAFHEHLSLAQANGRHALLLMSRGMRLGGYRSPTNGATMQPFFQGSCGSSNPCTRDGGGTSSDQVAIQYEPVNGLDCAGNTVPANAITADVYYVAADASNNNINGLFCQGYDPVAGTSRGAAQLLVDGVERLQAVYGLEGATAGTVNRYVAANAVTNWNQVRAIRLGVLVNSGRSETAFDQKTRQFNLLESGNLSFIDSTARFVYTTAVKLNNAGL